eukprot:12892727-Prorocentrum_lima.AAC.1
MGPTDSVESLLHALHALGVHATGRVVRANHPIRGQPARMLAIHARPQSVATVQRMIQSNTGVTVAGATLLIHEGGQVIPQRATAQ